MGRSFYTITVLVGFLAGVYLHLFFRADDLFLLNAVLFGILILLLSVRFFSGKIKNVLMISGVFIISLCFGLFRAGVSEHHTDYSQIDFYNGQKVTAEGIITEADIRRDAAKYTIRVEYIDKPSAGNISESRLQSGGSLLISLNKYPQYDYGDRVVVTGELKEPGEFDGFSYSDYLSRYGIYSVMYYPRITVKNKGEGNFFGATMVYMQNKFMEKISDIFPEPQASFEAGLLIGARKGIPDDIMQNFNTTGLTHIIAISGYNITIIILFIGWMLKKLPRKTGFIISVACIILFVLFVGAGPSVVRAGIMGILGLIALNYGRQNNIHITVLLSAVFMILWNPKILWWDVGFQLSFAAVLGLIYVAPVFEKYLSKVPHTFGIKEALMMTISAQVIAFPIIIYNFGRFSIIAPLANLLVAFAIPPAMLFGFLAVIFSIIHGLGSIFGYIAWGILTYIIKIIGLLAAVPFASVDCPGMGGWIVILYYVFLCLALIIHKKMKPDGD